MNVAIVYDRVNKWGGAERVLLELHKMFPAASLYTSLYSPRKAKWAHVFKVKTSFLQKISMLRDKHELLGVFMPLAFESFDFSDFDLVISVTSESAKGIITGKNTVHICICLTPTRYLWSDYDKYFKNRFFKLISYPAVFYLKKWERMAIKRPDKIIAISNHIKRKIKKYYKVESDVIYPPASSLLEEHKITKPKDKNYYLVVSRLVPYKRIDIPVKAATKLKLPLIVIGRGVEKKNLKAVAGKNVKFIDFVSEDLLRGYLKNAKALIYPSEEDFGIGMVEAQLHGIPVIAFGKGASREIIISGKTGEFFEKQSVNSLTLLLKKFKKDKYNKNDCYKNGLRFSNKKFRDRLSRYIKDAIINNR
jgi:glycosyltransferase involved in cell wall biosynthesis